MTNCNSSIFNPTQVGCDEESHLEQCSSTSGWPNLFRFRSPKILKKGFYIELPISFLSEGINIILSNDNSSFVHIMIKLKNFMNRCFSVVSMNFLISNFDCNQNIQKNAVKVKIHSY